MSSKKSGKKKRSRGLKTEGTSAEQVVFGLLSELLSRGVEHGAYKWCLQKNADPKRTVFVSCVPAEMPDGVICAIMARTLNRGLVEIVDIVKSADSVYQSLLVQAEGNIDSEACQTLIRCEDCPLGYWIMITPLEDSNIELATVEVDPPSVNEGPPPRPKVSTDKTVFSSKDPPVLSMEQPAVKAQPSEKKDFCSAEEPPKQEGLHSAMAPSKQGKMLLGTVEPLQVREPLLVAKKPSLKASTTKELSLLEKGLPSMRKPSSETKMPLVCQQLPPPSKVLAATKLLPDVNELPPETNTLFDKEETSLNVLIPSVRKVVLPVKDSLPSAKLSLPIKGAEISKSDKYHQTVLNEMDTLVKLSTRENIDTVVSNLSPVINFGTQDRIKFPVTKLPNVTYDPVWGGVSMERQKRRDDIEKGLHFIQSTIPFNGSQEEYKHFLQGLVENLYKEGNDLFHEGDVKLALGQYTEGLTVADYAASEDIVLSQELLCRLFVNRSCCYYSMGLFEMSLEDGEKALNLDKENMRALYRKAKTLDKLGKHQEAYSCISHRILALVQDESVTELAQELVQKLGLKQRRAYRRPQQELEKFGLLTNGISVSADSKASNNMGTVDDIYTDFPSELFPSSHGINYPNNRLEAAAHLPSLAPSMAPAANNYFTDCDVIGDELDSFLELEMASKHVPQLIPVLPPGNRLLTTLGSAGLPASSPLPPASFGLLDTRKPLVVPARAPLKTSFNMHLDTLDRFDCTRETLDSLDTFVNDSKPLEPVSVKGNANHKDGGNTVNLGFIPKIDPVQNHSTVPTPAMPVSPLMQTYEFKQGCQQCYVRIGIKALDFTYREKLDHQCKKDILLGRMKNAEKKAWLKIRPRPTKDFSGPYMLCKDIQSRQDCKYGDNCTFAYYQEEIDVWNEEKKGTFHRDQLFQPLALLRPGNVARLLHEQNGIFTFLCQACFDSKPQLISKRNPDNSQFCTNPSNPHRFNDHKCLVHVLNSSMVKYSKIRPLHFRFQMDVCRHEMRYGCLQEDTCNFAHSHVELCVWMLQKHSGVTQEEIVLESERMWKVPERKTKSLPKPLDMKMKFVCGQCLRNGREIEADRDGKYCTAKARHSWTNDKRVMLMMSKSKKKWAPIRPLPSIRSFPQQYEICVHVQNGKKCQYIGNCTFAHSTEEKDIWTFMKENKVLDLQQLFNMCNKSNSTEEKPGKPTVGVQKDTEKQILMPTDYADLMAGFHCYLCGKNSNSEKQWQKHIQSEKHKDRVFTLESEDSPWKYRFPAGEFKLCDRFEEMQSCPNENNCPFAHGRDELAEWHERRQVLQRKVSKARKDKLLEPSDSDFGKYTFLMQDLAQGSDVKETQDAL